MIQLSSLVHCVHIISNTVCQELKRMEGVQLQKETKRSTSTRKCANEIKKRQRYKPNSDQILRKRQPPKLSRRNNDVYITNKSSFKGQLAKCEKLLEKGEKEILLHGLGAAVPRAIHLALQLKDKHYGTLEIAVNTSSIGVVDDLEPANDSGTFETQIHQKSSVHIRVFRASLSDMN